MTCTSKLITLKVSLRRGITFGRLFAKFLLKMAFFCDHTNMQLFTTANKDECGLP